MRCMFSTAVENQHSFSVPLLTSSCLKAVHLVSDCLIDMSLVQSEIQDGDSFKTEAFLMSVETNIDVSIVSKSNFSCNKSLGKIQLIGTLQQMLSIAKRFKIK